MILPRAYSRGISGVVGICTERATFSISSFMVASEGRLTGAALSLFMAASLGVGLSVVLWGVASVWASVGASGWASA